MVVHHAIIVVLFVYGMFFFLDDSRQVAMGHRLDAAARHEIERIFGCAARDQVGVRLEFEHIGDKCHGSSLRPAIA